MKNILLIRLSSLGDIVLTSPAIRAVREHFPQAHISMLVAKQSAELFTENPHLDEVIPFDRMARNKDTLEMVRIVRILRELEFELAIDFQRKVRTSLLAYLSGAKCRVGYHEPNGFLCTVRVPRQLNKHVVDHYFDLLHAINIPTPSRELELFLAEPDRAYVRDLLNTQHGVAPSQIKVGLFPGAGWKLREWMPDRFAAIGDRIAKHFDAQVLIFGGPGDRELVNHVADLMTTTPLAFTQPFGIRQFAALIEQCDLFVTNDTGPMHIAAAMQTPTISLFGPGNHIRFQPLNPIHTTIRHHVPCNPCKQFTDKCKDNICMKLITVDEVWETVCQKL
jgi:lipopolysaccharide heptosyltransferase II